MADSKNLHFDTSNAAHFQAENGHNSDLGVEPKSQSLLGKKIALCVGGGIAAIQAPKVARELRRLGAKVVCYTTPNALEFVGKMALEWSSAQPCISALSGLAEHISTCDGVLVYPATTNLLGMLYSGLAMDPVSTLLQSAAGSATPILLCPSMHPSLMMSPFVQRNKEEIKSISKDTIHFLEPDFEEGKYKAPHENRVALEMAHLLNFKNNKVVLVTSGGTKSFVDSVRYIGNDSSGALGWEIIQELYAWGFKIRHLKAHTSFTDHSLKNVSVETCPEYETMLGLFRSLELEPLEGVFHLAAVSDYFLENKAPGKLKSNQQELQLKLQKTIKLISLPLFTKSPFKMACKLTAHESTEDLQIATDFASFNNLDAVIWNPSFVLKQATYYGKIAIKQEDHSYAFSNPFNSKKKIANEAVKQFLISRKGQK